LPRMLGYSCSACVQKGDGKPIGQKADITTCCRLDQPEVEPSVSESVEFASEFVDSSTDPNKYRSLDSIAEVIRRGDAKLVKGSWLVSQTRSAQLPHRQALESSCPGAYWASEELIPNMERSEFADFVDSMGTIVKLVAISYSWWCDEHPDPDGHQVNHLLGVLFTFMESYKCDTGVFLDWCSLYQSPRSPTEEAVYERSLDDMHLWYTHPRIKVWLMPGLSLGARQYRTRGWPLFEVATSIMIHESKDVLDISRFVMGHDYVANLKETKAKREPVKTPSDFALALERRTFSHIEDYAVVMGLYRKAYAEAMGGAVKLNFASQRWSPEGACRFAKSLPYCKSLETLDLTQNPLGDVGCDAIAAALPHCKRLKHLILNSDEIGDPGACALARRMSGCPSLVSVRLKYNHIADPGAYALAKAVPECKTLEFLYLYGNAITRPAAAVLIVAWERCAKHDSGELGIFPPDELARAPPGAECAVS